MAARRHAVAQRPDTGALVHLYDVDLTLHGGPVLHWTPGPLNSRGRNLVKNPNALKDTAGWTGIGITQPTQIGRAVELGPSYNLPAWGNGYASRPAGLAAGEVSTIRTQTVTAAFAETPGLPEGGILEASVRVVPIRCQVSIRLLFFDAAGNDLGGSVTTSPVANAGTPSKANQLGDYSLLFIHGTVPAGTKYAEMRIRMTGVGLAAATAPIVIWTQAQMALVAQATNYPLPFMPPSIVGAVKFGGVTYNPLPVGMSEERTSTQGPLPRPRVTVPNIGNYASTLLAGYKNMLRAKVTRRLVFDRFLDDGTEPDPTDFYGPDIWYIDRVAELTPEQVTLELASPLDVQGKMLPGRVCIRNVCTHVYRTWNPASSTFIPGTCPYAGPSYWKADGTGTGNPAEDDCGRRLRDCDLRFPYPTPLPTRAFPGMVRGRV